MPIHNSGIANNVEKEDRIAYSITEVSVLTTLSISHLRRKIKTGDLKVRKIGTRRIIVLRADLMHYLRGEENE